MTTYSEVDVRCPFYISDTERPIGIRCEGITDESRLALNFINKRHKMLHMRGFCNINYEKCPLFRIIYEKYEV